MLFLRFVWAGLTLPLRALIDLLVFQAVGLVLVPLAIATGRKEISRTFPKHVIYNAPKLLWLWGNDEDGYDPEWYAERQAHWSRFKRRYVWAAIRNPTNNLRFIRRLHPAPRADKVRAVRGDNWYLCWQGPFSRFVFTGKKREYSIGWKYRPDDVLGVDPMDHRLFGTGFGVKVKRID